MFEKNTIPLSVTKNMSRKTGLNVSVNIILLFYNNKNSFQIIIYPSKSDSRKLILKIKANILKSGSVFSI